MTEKAAVKKDNQKNKKSKQNEKKKKYENGWQNVNERSVPVGNNVNHKKKDKNNKNNAKAFSKRKHESLLKRYFKLFFLSTSYLFLFFGFLYLVDYEKYMNIREGAIYVLNKTLSFLPEEVVKQGKKVIIPPAEAIVGKLNLIINHTTSFLNTNPLIKSHWINIREISTVCGARLVEYLRVLYLHVTQYCNDAKAKLF